MINAAVLPSGRHGDRALERLRQNVESVSLLRLRLQGQLPRHSQPAADNALGGDLHGEVQQCGAQHWWRGDFSARRAFSSTQH